MFSLLSNLQRDINQQNQDPSGLERDIDKKNGIILLVMSSNFVILKLIQLRLPLLPLSIKPHLKYLIKLSISSSYREC